MLSVKQISGYLLGKKYYPMCIPIYWKGSAGRGKAPGALVFMHTAWGSAVRVVITALNNQAKAGYGRERAGSLVH